MEETRSGSVFSITPMSAKLRLVAGEVYEGVIKVFTPANMEGNFSYKVEVAPYNVSGADYVADLVTQSNRSQIVDWIRIAEPSGTLGPNGTKEVHYTITVPETAPAGGQYAAILVGTDGDGGGIAEGVGVNSVFEMASIVYAQVEGEIQRSGEIQLNEVPGFITATPMKVMVELKNDGNIHEVAKIDIAVKNFLTGAQIYPSNNGEGWIEEVVMPETTRVVAREITEMPALGVYEVTQTVDYMGKHSSITQLVVACPIWFMVMVGVVIGLIIGGIVMAVKKHKRNKMLAV
ncbi:hypothetical protein IJH23_00030 [Candidatus Saccharibacteria bacterium]|nr:hypothetical protein [Candidatus Saccharibacteria bacterium]MBQ3470096.1 hypothetical protein [Candidatus Saccharibacteria bacterium]